MWVVPLVYSVLWFADLSHTVSIHQLVSDTPCLSHLLFANLSCLLTRLWVLLLYLIHCLLTTDLCLCLCSTCEFFILGHSFVAIWLFLIFAHQVVSAALYLSCSLPVDLSLAVFACQHVSVVFYYIFYCLLTFACWKSVVFLRLD